MAFWNDIWDWIEGAVNSIGNWFEEAFNDFGDWIEGAINDIGDWFEGAINWVGKAFEDLVGGVKEVVSKTEGLTAELGSESDFATVFGDGKSVIHASTGKDDFLFSNDSTGDIYKNEADVIKGFNASQDKIHVPEDLTYGGNTSVPANGTFSVWQKDDHYVVTWKDANGFNDIVVYGDNPVNSIEADVKDTNIIVAGTQKNYLLGTNEADAFVFNSDTTGDYYGSKKLADQVYSFDESEDVIVIPDGMTYAGNSNSPGHNQYTVWTLNETFDVVTWKDEKGYHDILVHGDNPLGEVVSESDMVLF